MSATRTTKDEPQLPISTTHPPVDPEADYYGMMFGRGAGDPDVQTPPWELADGTLDPHYKRVNNVEED